MSNVNSDCLVLKIQEYVDDDLDTILYILYDIKEEIYLIKGKRTYIDGNVEPIPYSFNCKYASDLLDFISFLICKNSTVRYTLYNYNDLPNVSDDIDFDYLKNLDENIEYELVCYDNQPFNKKNLLKYLRILRNVFNYY